MNDADFQKLVASVKEAGEIKAGRKEPSRAFEIKPPEIKRIRKKLNASQRDFALMIGVSTRTLQNWEQGRRSPHGPARVLLSVAEKHPDVLWEVVQEGRA